MRCHLKRNDTGRWQNDNRKQWNANIQRYHVSDQVVTYYMEAAISKQAAVINSQRITTQEARKEENEVTLKKLLDRINAIPPIQIRESVNELVCKCGSVVVFRFTNYGTRQIIYRTCKCGEVLRLVANGGDE